MATQYVGNAGIRYASTGATAETEVRLGTPLHDLRPGEARARYVTDNVKRTNREVVTIGNPLDEVTGTVRFHNDAGELVDLVSKGLDGVKLKYVPDLAEPTFQYHCRLVDGGDVQPDPDRAGRKEFQTTLTLRQWSSTAEPFDSLTYGKRLLFQYEPGRDLNEVGTVFTSTAARTYTSYTSTSASAGVDIARDAHYQTLSGAWTRTLKLEGSSAGSTRIAESLYFTWNHPPQAQTVYMKAVERGTIKKANAGIFHIGGPSLTASYLRIYSNGVNYGLNHGTTAGDVYGTLASGAATTGQLFELCGQLYANGKVQLFLSVNEGAIVSSPLSSAHALDGTWQASRMYVGQTAGQNIGEGIDVVKVSVAPGVRSMAYMRTAP